MEQIRRRDFLKVAALSSGYFMTPKMLWAKTQPDPKPNIIFILTDQQSASMMSCAANPWLKTPAMDSIAENGIRFTRAYTTNPVCSPARVSFMTGRFAGAFNDNKGQQARENKGSMNIPSIPQDVEDTTIAVYLKQAGYDLVYGGKEHLPNPLQPTALGFKDITNDERQELAEKASGFIKAKHDKPYFMMLSFINPHDICYMALRDAEPPEKRQQYTEKYRPCQVLDTALQMPDGVTEEAFFETYCPPLPDNYEPQKDEPKAIGSLLDRRSFRRNARETYSNHRWRQHRWAYCRLTERVDGQIQMVLDAVKAAGQEENTLILFSSDHGDMDAAHRMEHKTALYEESANIPFLAMWKKHIQPGKVDTTHLVSNGLDLLPTVCDYAGVKAVSDPRGRSLRPLIEGKDVPWRKTLGVESEIGRMVVDKDGFKFIQYDAVGIEEQLLNLNEDPHETTHFTNDPRYASKLAELKKSFETEWFPNLP
jgi:choline-sulfatase